MGSDRGVSRRRFFQGAAAGLAAGIGAPYVLPRSAFGANERVLTGHIGVGSHGMTNLNAHLSRAIAVCDVDTTRLARAVDAVTRAGGTCEGYGDFRRLLDRKDVDAVVVSTPDHWHALMTVRACEAGKDVYCEKPLTLTIAEGRRVVEVARRTQRIVQTGSQQRSAPNFRRACGLVRAGRLGRIQRVLAGIPGVNFRGPAVPDSAPPPELDYGLWLGPAALRPYNANRVHYNFRFFWDYSGGQLTNWGAHQNDIAQWGLGMDTSGPVEIRGEATYDETRLYEVPKWCEATYTYANGVTLVCRTDPRVGITFEGANGRLVVAGGTLTSEPPDLLGLQKETLGGDPARLRPGDDHHGNWLECIRSRKLPVCDVEIGHRSATVCHLGNIAMRCGRAVRWDPAREQIVGDDEANRMLSRPCREPWRL